MMLRITWYFMDNDDDWFENIIVYGKYYDA